MAIEQGFTSQYTKDITPVSSPKDLSALWWDLRERMRLYRHSAAFERDARAVILGALAGITGTLGPAITQILIHSYMARHLYGPLVH